MNLVSARRALALSCCHHWWMPSSVHRHPSTSSALTRFFARLAGKDIGARFALTLLQVVIQRAARLIHQVDGSFLATLMRNGHPSSLEARMESIEQQPGDIAHTAPGEVGQVRRRPCRASRPLALPGCGSHTVGPRTVRAGQGAPGPEWRRLARDCDPGADDLPAASGRTRIEQHGPAFCSWNWAGYRGKTQSQCA